MYILCTRCVCTCVVSNVMGCTLHLPCHLLLTVMRCYSPLSSFLHTLRLPRLPRLQISALFYHNLKRARVFYLHTTNEALSEWAKIASLTDPLHPKTESEKARLLITCVRVILQLYGFTFKIRERDETHLTESVPAVCTDVKVKRRVCVVVCCVPF